MAKRGIVDRKINAELSSISAIRVAYKQIAVLNDVVNARRFEIEVMYNTTRHTSEN